MPRQTRYLLTVDSDTGTAVKLERLGEAGELTEVPLGMLSGVSSAPAPQAGVAMPAALSPQSLVINIYMGGPQPAAPPSYSVREPPGPGSRPMGPGGPGGTGSASGEGGTS